MSDVIAAAVLEVQGDMSDFIAKIAKAEEVAKRFEAASVQAAGRASGALAGVGKGAGEGLKDLDPVTRRAAEGMQLMAAKATLSAGELALFRAAAKGANVEALGPMATLLDKISAKQAAAAAGAGGMAAKLGLVGISAGQATAAMRSLPAQFTDIATQLQGGASPFTVLLQQGGQIKDQFGGVGNAFRALGSVLTPVRLLFGGVAAAAGAAGLAYKQGAAETDEYRKALALTNNTAGKTIGQLQVMAQAVSGITGGTQGKAAEVLTALAASAKVAGSDLTKLTAAAIQLERAGGPAALETAKAFAALAEAPTQAALTLTKSTGFLTAAVYEQARALELQGRTSAAASVVQQAYATSVEGATKKLEGGLGLLEKAWRGVGDWAKSAWDAMLGLGRAESVESRVASAAEALAKAQKLSKLPAFGSSPLANQSAIAQDFQGANAAAGYENLNAFYEQLRVKNEKAAIDFSKLAESVRAPGDALRDQIKQIDEWGAAFVAVAKEPVQAAKAVEALKARVTSLSAVSQQASATAQAALQASAAVQAAQTSAKLQDLQHQRAMGLISEIDLLGKVGAANVEAAQAEERRIQQAIANAKRLPAEQQGAALAGLRGQAEAAAIRTDQEKAKVQNQITEAVRNRVLAAEALTRAEGESRALEMAEYEKSVGDAYRASAIAAADYAQSLQDARQSMVDEAAASQLSDLQRDIRLRQLAIELRLRQEIRAIQSAPYSPDQKDILIAQATANATSAASLAVDQVTQEFQTRGAREISDALLTAMQGGFDDAWDYLKQLAKREVIKVLFQPVANTIGGVLSGVITQAQGGAATNASYLQAASGMNTLYGYGKSAYGWLTGAGAAASSASMYGLAGASGSLGASTGSGLYALGAGGTGSGLSVTAGTNAAWGISGSSAAASSGSSAAATASSWGPYVAAIVASYLVSANAYKQGFTNANTDNSFIDSGVAGSMGLGGPMYVSRLLDSLGIGSSRNNQIFSGAAGINYLIGRGAPRIDQQGVQGTIGAGGFSGEGFADVVQKGGLFRSDKRWTETGVLSEEIDRFFDAASKSIFEKAKDFGAALGLPAAALADVTQSVKVALGDDAAKNQEEITKALASYGDALVAGYADAIKPLAVYGETTVQTIERVGGALQGTNEVLSALGLNALQASIAGGQAAVSLQDLFGGLDVMQQAAGSYLADFYSDTERSALSLSAIGRVLQEVGVAVPATRDSFRDLVDAQDLTTASGREAFTALMSVASAFADVVPAARSVTDIMAERMRLEEELLTVQGDTAALRARERAELDESNRALYDQIQALRDQKSATDAARQAADEAAAAAERLAASAAQLAAAWDQSNASAADGVRAAFAAVASAIGAEQQSVKSAAEQQLQAVQVDADRQLQDLEAQAQSLQREFGSLFEGLRGNIQSLLGDLAGDGGRAAALATLQDARRVFRSGGTVDLEAVRQAGGVAARLGTDTFATRLDFAREQGRTVALLQDVSTSARAQLGAQTSAIAAQQVAIESARDAQVAAIEQARDAQLATLSAQLDEARTAASALVSIDDGVQGVAAALAQLAEAVSATRLLQGGGGPTGQILESGGQQVYGSTTGAVVTRAAGAGWDQTLVRGRSGATATASVLRSAVDELVATDNWARIVQVALAEGIDSNTLDGLMDWRAGTARAAAALRGLPAFAMGSAYVPQTGPALVHEGERIITAADNAALTRRLTQPADDTLQRELLAELRAFRQQSMTNDAALASYTNRAQALLNDVVNGGASIATRAEA